MKRRNWVSVLAISLVATAACGMIMGIEIITHHKETKKGS